MVSLDPSLGSASLIRRDSIEEVIMRLFNVGVVTLALLASTAMASAQSSMSQKHHVTRHRHTTMMRSEPQGNSADFQGNVTEPVAGPHYGRAEGGTSYNRTYPNESDDVNKMLEWKNSR
jgi:hypothetical protein